MARRVVLAAIAVMVCASAVSAGIVRPALLEGRAYLDADPATAVPAVAAAPAANGQTKATNAAVDAANASSSSATKIKAKLENEKAKIASDIKDETAKKAQKARSAADKQKINEENKVEDARNTSCGCKNDGQCKLGKCICDWQWEGEFCEAPSQAVKERENELKRIEQLSKNILDISKAVADMEKQGGTKAIAAAVQSAANKQLSNFELLKERNDFEVALSRGDWLKAQSAMTAAGQVDKDFIKDWDVLLTEARNKASTTVNSAPGVKTMPIPVMHEDLYKNVDTTKALELNLTKFEAGNQVVSTWDAQHRAFTLEYGEPV